MVNNLIAYYIIPTYSSYKVQSPNLKTFKESRNRFQGVDSASLYSLRNRFLGSRNVFKFGLSSQVTKIIKFTCIEAQTVKMLLPQWPPVDQSNIFTLQA